MHNYFAIFINIILLPEIVMYKCNILNNKDDGDAPISFVFGINHYGFERRN